MVLLSKKGQVPNSPPPFSSEELQSFLETPLYSGYKSRKRLTTVGDCHVREGHWWAGILMMSTGMRAGELSQLLVSDFDFEHHIPHVKIRNVNNDGVTVKKTKNTASVRDTPISASLIDLGLAVFVAARGRSGPNKRVFSEFRLGTGGRVSDGMTKFWSSYLKQFGLWKEGRATHVWRHTLVARLRLNEVAEEEISAYVGHTLDTITGAYGGSYPLSRKLKTLEKLDFGFDLLEAAGGKFIKERHA